MRKRIVHLALMVALMVLVCPPAEAGILKGVFKVVKTAALFPARVVLWTSLGIGSGIYCGVKDISYREASGLPY